MVLRTRSPGLIALGGLLALAAAMGIGRFVYTPILPFMVEAIPLGHADAGLIASVNFLGYLVGALAASLGALPGSHRFWFLGALALSATTTAAMAATSGIWAFVLFRFAGGAASAFVLVFSSALVLERLNRAGRPGLSALHFAGVGCGIAFSAVAVAALAQQGVTWRGQWVTSGVMTLLCLALAAIFVPAEVAPRGAVDADGAPRGRPKWPLVRLIAAYGLFGFGYVITATFISLIVREIPALNPAEPYVWLAVGLAAAPSVYLWLKVASLTGGRLAFSIACVVEAGGVALSVVAQSPAAVVAAAVFLGGTFMGITALGLMEARKLSPGTERQSLAVMTASFGLGQMVGPMLAGLLRQATGSFEIASFSAAAALLLAAALVRR